MPNWVFCNLSVSGTKELVEQFDADMKQPHPEHTSEDGDKKWAMSKGGEFSFWNAVAPTDVEDYFENNRWYGWNCDNWGCKWDANVEDEDTFTYPAGEENHTYRFDTAWSPPLGAFAAICAKYPELNFSLSYEEEQGWGGEVESDDEGGVIQVEEYDIPESHADYAKRDREDSCNCAWADDETDWYADCPRGEEDESKTIVVEDLTSLMVS